jgi:hypothetical protein
MSQAKPRGMQVAAALAVVILDQSLEGLNSIRNVIAFQGVSGVQCWGKIGSILLR